MRRFRFTAFLFVAIFMLSMIFPISTHAAKKQKQTYENLYYSINYDNTITITGYSSETKELIIPESIAGLPVTCIGWEEYSMTESHIVPFSGAFANNKTLESIYIPDSVIYIENSTFYNCSNLKSVRLPDNLMFMGSNVFTGTPLIEDDHGVLYYEKWCIGLSSPNESTSVAIRNGTVGICASAFLGRYLIQSISIPTGLKHICDGAFANCNALRTITIPESATDIGSDVFSQTFWLYNKQSISPIVVINGILIDGSKASGKITLPNGIYKINKGAFSQYSYDNNTSALTEITIPNSVTSIEDGAFSGCTGLTSIIIPGSVTSIGACTFHNCTSLTSITIPDSITSIGLDTFSGCTGLTNITLPNKMTSIGAYAFAKCTGLTSIAIPDSVTSIEDGAFSGCTSLTSITIPDNVTSIGNMTFHDCTGLTRITIPDNISSIGYYAFGYCYNLTEITIPDSVTSIGYAAFEGCQNLKSIKLPSGILSIEERLFSKCDSLEFIAVPDSVTSIGREAFYRCSRLTEITLPDNIKVIEESTFEGCSLLSEINIPSCCEAIRNYAFCSCYSLSNITIPRKCREIGEKAFTSDYPYYTDILYNSETDSVNISYPDSATFLKKITILNPDCQIKDQASTITSDSFYSRFSGLGVGGSAMSYFVDDEHADFHYSGIICGYDNSTAQLYAEHYGYKFESLGEAPESTGILGDVTDDGEVGAEDAQLALIAYVSSMSGKDHGLTDEQFLAADVNKNGELSVDDAQNILIYYVTTKVSGKNITWDELLNKNAPAKTRPQSPPVKALSAAYHRKTS